MALSSVAACALLAAALAAAPQQLPWQAGPPVGAAKEPVVYEYPEQIQLTVGKTAQVALHFRIRDGLHINSHAPYDKNLIRTELVVAEPTGIDVQAVSFPKGSDYATQAFPGEKLSVYTGEIVLDARLLATEGGIRMLSAALRYQACDAERCFPPRSAPVALSIIVR